MDLQWEDLFFLLSNIRTLRFDERVKVVHIRDRYLGLGG